MGVEQLSEGDRLAQEEEARAALLLKAWVEHSGKSVRGVELQLGWSQARLNKLLAGSTPLRVAHIAAVCSALGRPIAEFYATLAGVDPRAVDAMMKGASLGFAGELGQFADAAVAAGYDQGVIRQLLDLVFRLKH